MLNMREVALRKGGCELKNVMEIYWCFNIFILTEYDAIIPACLLDTDKALGLDYSNPHFYADSQGAEADMRHSYRHSELWLAREQCKLSKILKGSANYQKQKRRGPLFSLEDGGPNGIEGRRAGHPPHGVHELKEDLTSLSMKWYNNNIK